MRHCRECHAPILAGSGQLSDDQVRVLVEFGLCLGCALLRAETNRAYRGLAPEIDYGRPFREERT